MIAELDPLSAVTAPDPYPYYAQLVAKRPFYRDERLNMWIASSAQAVESVLRHEALRVRPASEPVPNVMLETPLADLFAQLARMTDGPNHDRVKATLALLFERFDAREIASKAMQSAVGVARDLDVTKSEFVTEYAFAVPAMATALLLGIPYSAELLAWTKQFVEALRASATAQTVALGIDGARNIARLLGADGFDAQTANAIGLLFQSYDATAALILGVVLHLARGAKANTLDELIATVVRYDSPVQNTRRFAASDASVAWHEVKAGEVVLVLLGAANHDPANADRILTFGLGGHACPARDLAVAITRAAITHLWDLGFDPKRVVHLGYLPSPNCRIPHLQQRA